MKPIIPTPDWLKCFCLEDLDRISQILSQLQGDYETSTDQKYSNFLFSLHAEINKLISQAVSYEDVFSLWYDQHIVREAIEQEYYEQQVP